MWNGFVILTSVAFECFSTGRLNSYHFTFHASGKFHNGRRSLFHIRRIFHFTIRLLCCIISSINLNLVPYCRLCVFNCRTLGGFYLHLYTFWSLFSTKSTLSGRWNHLRWWNPLRGWNPPRWRMGGFNFICVSGFHPSLLGFHRALRDFIEKSWNIFLNFNLHSLGAAGRRKNRDPGQWSGISFQPRMNILFAGGKVCWQPFGSKL